MLLSTFGRQGEPEDLAYIDIYLMSLKRHVVPYFDLKVLMFFTGAGDLRLTRERIEVLGLQNIIILKNIDEMELPQVSVDFWKGQHWFHKVGLNMNLMFDYAARHDFFGAEWILHVDTDLEFLPNFKQIFDKVNSLREINPNIIVTLAGDTFDYHFKYKNKEYELTDPTRINWYDESGETLKHTFTYRNVEIKTVDRPEETTDYNKLVFNIQQQKIRNDFILMPRVTALQYGHTFNWISYHYPYNFNHHSDNESQLELEKIWNENIGNANLTVHVNNDKGSTVQLFLQGGEHTITKLQLMAHDNMVRHYGSGWYLQTNFIELSYRQLQNNYKEYAELFEQDFANTSTDFVSKPKSKNIEQKQIIKNRITELENSLNELKEMIKNM